jgi:hypothetical protein
VFRNLVSGRTVNAINSKSTPQRRQGTRDKVRAPLETPTRRKTRSLALSGEYPALARLESLLYEALARLYGPKNNFLSLGRLIVV